MEKKIVFRTVVELLGKPQEHVEKTMKQYIEKLKQDKHYKVLKVEFAEIKKQEKEELWATFAELEVAASDLIKLTDFCLDYMPSIIEIIEPESLTIPGGEFSFFLNDFQSKLHGVDMVAKHVKAENDVLKKNMVGLLKNYITILLKGREGLTSEQLFHLTGVEQEKLEDFLDQLIDEGKVDLKGDFYSLVEKSPDPKVS